VFVDEEIHITARLHALDRIALRMTVEGKSDCERRVFSGNINVVLTKQQIRRLRNTLKTPD
jgi:hypothetical protein